MKQHIDILGWLYIAFGALGLLGAAVVLIAAVGGGLLSRDAESAALFSGIGFFVAVLVGALSLPNLIGGWGLLKRKSWSRILVIVLGCLGLLSIPLGTALGIYTLWALTKPEARGLLSQ
ncbi:MAG: hypothetical protein LC785_06145 [Acidobacteria bacterium]|nr:hypothetical protein [Acidobacteriota bacterium]